MGKDDEVDKKPPMPFSFKPNPARRFLVPSAPSSSSEQQPSTTKILRDAGGSSGNTNPSQFLASLDRMSKGAIPPVSIKIEDTGIKHFPRRSNEKRPATAKRATIELPKKKETSSSKPSFADTKPFVVPKRPQPESSRFKQPECPLPPQPRHATLFKRNDREENPLLELADRPNTPRYKQEPSYEFDRKLLGQQQLSEPSRSTAQDSASFVYSHRPSVNAAPLYNPFNEEHESSYEGERRHALSAPSSQQQPAGPIKITRNEPPTIDDGDIDQLVRVCKDKMTKSMQAHAYATNQIHSLQATVDTQQRAIQESEARSNDMSRWIQTMMSRQHRFDQSVASLRGRYDAFYSVMGDLEKLAEASIETRISNAKAFEEFEQRYCNTLREQLDALKRQSEEMHSSFASLRLEQEDIKELALSLTEECSTYRSTLSEYETQCQQHMAIVDDLKGQTSELHKQLEYLSSTSNQFKDEITESKSAYQELRTKWSYIRSVITEVENALSESHAASLERDGTSNEVQTMLAETMDTHRQTCEHYEQVINNLEMELKSTKSRYEDEVKRLKDENVALMGHNSALAEELSHEKEKYKRLESEAEKRQKVMSAANASPRSNEGSTSTAAAQAKAPARNKRPYPEIVEHPLPKCGTSSMTLRSSSMPTRSKQQVKEENSDDEFQIEEPLTKKRRKRTLIRRKPPPEKPISLDSDDDPEKEIQAFIASMDPYKKSEDSNSSKQK